MRWPRNSALLPLGPQRACARGIDPAAQMLALCREWSRNRRRRRSADRYVSMPPRSSTPLSASQLGYPRQSLRLSAFLIRSPGRMPARQNSVSAHGRSKNCLSAAGSPLRIDPLAFQNDTGGAPGRRSRPSWPDQSNPYPPAWSLPPCAAMNMATADRQ
jgi:hypothetical protein